MIGKIIKRIIICFILILGGNVVAQTVVDDWAKHALVVGRSLPQERVYLQFDNDVYYLGETIWFRAYVTSGNNDMPTSFSRVLYVELVSPEGYVVETKKYKLHDDGSCDGEFELTARLLSGLYEIRAYTRYMLNWGEEAVFSRVFPVFDKVNANNWDFKNMLDRQRVYTSDNKSLEGKLPDADLKFYPEGGNLVDGIECRVAFELFGVDGEFGTDSVTVFENKNRLLGVAPVHNGKGCFNFIPDSENSYRAYVKCRNKNNEIETFEFDLPKIEREGVVMTVSQDSANVNIAVRNNLSEIKELGFAVFHRGAMGFYKKISSDERSKLISIPKKDLLEGVSRAVVFIDDDIPLAERQFFVEHDNLQKGDRQTVKLRVTGNGSLLSDFVPEPNGKITLLVEREDSKPIADDMDFTVSVRDVAGEQATSWDYNMYIYMLLGSELKGYIPNAAQYFDRGNKERYAQLDLLMLTHGWTSYDWNKLTNVKVAEMQPVEKGITLSGTFFRRIENRRNNILLSYDLEKQAYNAVRMDISQGDSVVMSVFRTDSLGRFIIETEDFYGKRIAALSPELATHHISGHDYAFSLDRYFSPRAKSFHFWERNLGNSIDDFSKVVGGSDEIKRINPYEYMLGELDVVEKKRQGQFYRPPMSEIRLDYLDEWEYAQDVIYLKNSRYSQYHVDSLAKVMEHDKMLADAEGWLQGKDEDNGSEEINYSGPGLTERDRMPEYRDALTAADIMHSAAIRHNLNWSYWTHFAVVKDGYDPNRLPQIDDDYLHGKDPVKMTNFKEIVIRSDKEALNLIDNSGEGFWSGKHYALQNKHPYKMFYEGFMTRFSVSPSSAQIANDGAYGEFEKIRRSYETGHLEESMRHPNYLACFIPYGDNESETPIIPELQSRSSLRRYTMLQGYARSKRFYSPDYSKITPAGDDYRRTLLWMPRAKAKDGKLFVELYNTADCSALYVDVAGFSNNIFFGSDYATVTRCLDESAIGVNKSSSLDKGRTITEFTPDSTSLAAFEYRYKTGQIYYDKGNYQAAIVIFAELTQYAYPPAYYSVAVSYLNGRGVARKESLAADFMQRAAQMAYAPAQYEFAMMCKDGVGVETDNELYLYWLRNAVERDEPRALMELAKCYREGIFLERDTAMYVDLYRNAARLESADGLFYYASYMKDVRQAVGDEEFGDYMSCIEKSANRGCAEAQIYMMRHEDAMQNYKKAYRWARILSLDDNHIGTIYMADCYLHGRGVGRDKSLARDLYNKAALAGNEEAAKKLNELQ